MAELPFGSSAFFSKSVFFDRFDTDRYRTLEGGVIFSKDMYNIVIKSHSVTILDAALSKPANQKELPFRFPNTMTEVKPCGIVRTADQVGESFSAQTDAHRFFFPGLRDV